MPLPATPEDLPRAFCDAWMARDAAALAKLFAMDADFVNVTGIWWQDRAAIEAAHHYGLTTFFSASHLRTGRVKVRRLGDDLACVHARMILDGQTDRDGTLLGRRTTIFLFVVERTSEGWIAVAGQNTDIVPGAETHAVTTDGFEKRDYRTP